LWKALSVKETGATQSLHGDVRIRDRVKSGKGITNCTGGGYFKGKMEPA